MDKIVIVEYLPAYAKSVAEMWNASSDGWNGRNFCSSEAKVLQSESSSSYLNLYLAMQGDKVLGYAKLTKYAEEEGVAYIELLNALPSHHGQGIGRDLVKKCILRAAELGYERIDLFTWAGNTKAVPLYKKCGFFWEKMDNQSTHLMNFMPGLLNLELLKPIWEKLDWYSDTKRTLKIEPDGRQEHGFDFYDYVWEKGDTRLEISIERYGRGIVSVKTTDFGIKISSAIAKPVFGSTADLQYHLENYGNKPISLEVEGISDGLISHEYQHKAMLDSELDFSSQCYLAPLKRKLHEWETSPRAKAMLKLDGNPLPVAIGLKVQYPLTADLRGVESYLQPGHKASMFLNLESNFAQPCRYRISFPPHEHLSLMQSEFEVELEAGGRKSLTLEYTVTQTCAYYPKLQVEAFPEAAKPISFTLECYIAIYCPLGHDGVETTENIHLLSGKYYLSIDKIYNKNAVWFGSIFSTGISLTAPLPGKPYSEELESLNAYEVVLHDASGHIEAELRFKSREISGYEFAWIYRLYDNGLLELYPKLLKRPESGQELWMKLPFSAGYRFSEFSYWYDGFINTADPRIKDVWESDLPENCPQENWLFGRNDDGYLGIVWPEDTMVTKDRWCLAWQVDMNAQSARGRDCPQPLQIHLDVFKNAWQIRNYARGRKKTQPERNQVELVINGGNPMLTLPCKAEVIQNLDTDMKAEYVLGTNCNKEAPPLRDFTKEPGCQKLGWELQDAPPQPLERIETTIKLPYADITKAQVMMYGKGECRVNDKDNILGIDNGIISFAAARDASIPGLISLCYQGEELLDNAYPDYAPKGFLNPYAGGLSINPSSLSKKTMQGERHSLDTCIRHDQWGNKWQGLAFRTRIEKYEPLRGLEFSQIYLCLPGVPILAVMAEVYDLAERRRFYYFSGRLYPKRNSADAEEGCLFWLNDNSRQKIRWSDMEMRADEWCETLALYKGEKPNYLQMVELGRLFTTVSNDREVASLSFSIYTRITDPVPQCTNPLFMIFDTLMHDKKELRQLLGLEFSKV